MKAKRAQWPENFPDVLILATEPQVKGHPHYAAGKSGDADIAARLVRDLVADEQLVALGATLPAGTVVTSVHAMESTGVNAIPEALANRIAISLGLDIDDSIVQANVVNHTGASGFERLARQALFAGDVRRGLHTSSWMTS